MSEADVVWNTLRKTSSLRKEVEERLRLEIETLLEEGWTVVEVVSLLCNTEEINPNLGEEVALRNMRRVREAVDNRLKGEMR